MRPIDLIGDRVVEAEVKKRAARLDAASVAIRRRRAESERRVTVRPAPDVMTYVTALLPAAQGIAVQDGRPVVPVTIDLVITDRARFAGATDSAQCPTGCHIGCRWRNDVSAAASAGACVSASVWFAPSNITSSA